jgi:hypothetical protein
MLLRAYPASFRRQYGEEMTLVFREQASDAWDRAGRTGLARFWLHVFVDLAQTLPEQHLLACKRILQMETVAPTSTKTLVCLSLLAAFGLYLAAFCVLVTLSSILWLDTGDLSDLSMLLLESLLILSPAFLTGAIASRTKMFYRPYLIAPMAPMMIWATTGFFDNGAAWLLMTGCSLLVGAVTLLGCYTSERVFQRNAPSCPAGN